MLENNFFIKIVFWDSEDLYRNFLNFCSLGNYVFLIEYLLSLEDFREVYKMLWK